MSKTMRWMKLGSFGLAILMVAATGAFAQAELEVLATAQAQSTPDGETPAVETVCDGLEGQQFGLCNAYCEAMDCDSNSPNANSTACTKVRDRFLAAGGDESRLACGCPCDFSEGNLTAFFGDAGVDFCFNISATSGFPDSGWSLVSQTADGQSVAVVEFVDTFNTSDEIVHPSCGLQAPFTGGTEGFVGGLTQDQAVACRNQLLEFEPCDCGQFFCLP